MLMSDINRKIHESVITLQDKSINLPWFANPISQNLKEKTDEMIKCKLGWDVTDFGLGIFDTYGRVILPTRNGCQSYPKPYCEKYICGNLNRSPPHYHKQKTEDIINCGNGLVCVKLWKTREETDTGRAEYIKSLNSFDVSIDGVSTHITPGEILIINPGQSITIKPMVIHEFWNEDSISREISSKCDDTNDNFFINHNGYTGTVQRFPNVIMDEEPEFFMVNN
jgi:D-lyxose ketol-isomerase